MSTYPQPISYMEAKGETIPLSEGTMYKVRVIQLALTLGLALFVISSCMLVSESDAIGDSVEQNGVTY
jgi:hypothetical protein